MNIAINIVLALVIFAAGFDSGYKTSANSKEAEFGKERLTWQRSIIAGQADALSALSSNDALKTELEKQHDQANRALNTLLDAPVPSVRIPECTFTILPASAVGETQPAIGSQPAIEPDWALLAETNRVMEADRQRTLRIEAEAEQELISCREVKYWAESSVH